MTATYAQKQAVARYAAKKRALGMKSRTLFATDEQWLVLLNISRYIKTIDFDTLSGVEIDEDTGTINFIRKEADFLGGDTAKDSEGGSEYREDKTTAVEA